MWKFCSALLLLLRIARTVVVATNYEAADAKDALYVVSQGEKIREDARFPLTFLGDWKRVLVSPKIHVIATSENTTWSEGPVVRNETLYFSDTIRGNIYRKARGKQGLELWATHAGGIDPDLVAEPGSNGMATDSLDPRFVVINQHGLRRVVRCRLDDHRPGSPLRECPDMEVVADVYGAKDDKKVRFNSPNDVVVHPHDGSIWFTDPVYGLLEKTRFCDELSCETGSSYLDEKSEIGWKGVYRVDRGTQVVDLVTKFHRRPNGLAFSPDTKTLWVSDSTVGTPSWTAYEVLDPIRNRYIGKKATKVLTTATLGTILGTNNDLPVLTGGEGLTDGFKIDEWGNIWTSIPNGFAVIDVAKQEVICQILLGINSSNLAFGTNGDVWLTGLGGLWRIRRKTNDNHSIDEL